MKFRTKSVEVEAKQFNGTWDDAKSLIAWISTILPPDEVGMARWTSSTLKSSDVGTLIVPLCQETAKPGDWLVLAKSPGGSRSFTVMDNGTFRDKYEATSDRVEAA